MKRFIVVGLGIFGSTVAEALGATAHEVVAVDLDARKVDRIGPKLTRAVLGDARESDTLERVGVRGSDAAIVSTGDDISASILAVMALSDLQVGEIHVKVVSQDHARVMKKLGVTQTIFPERDSARNLANLLTHSRSLLNYVQLGAEFGLQEMAVPTEWEGRTLRQLELRNRYRISVVALHDVLTDKIEPAADPDAVLKVSDTLLIAGRHDDLERVADLK